jgi:rhomboid family protein
VVIPIHDRNPTQHPAYVTYALIAVNVVLFVLGPLSGLFGTSRSQADQACQQAVYFIEYAVIPREVIHNQPLDPDVIRVQVGNRVVACEVPQHTKIPFLSVLYAMFLHGGWLHLLGNMLFLYVFGNNVEDRLGHVRFLLFYLACGYIATYAFAAVNPDSTQPLVGASGAIAGVLGAYLWLFPRARVTSLVPFLLFIPVALPAWIVLGTWFVLQWIYFQGMGVAESTGVAYAAHVAGFLAGFGYAALFLRRRRPEPPRYQPAIPPPDRMPY